MSTRRPQQHRELLHETTPESTLVDTEPDGVETVIIHADGSYHQENDRSGTGFTLEKKNGRDTFREGWQTAPNADTSMETEAAAALAGVREALKFGPSYIILYSDCKPLVRILDSENEPGDDRAPVYKRTREMLSTVEFTTITHIPRDRNERAHDLAHRGLREAKDQDSPGQLDRRVP
jgi:ribonuclease HI